MENSTILSSIPLEVWYDILKRLPTKTLSRFRCVSKSWNSLIRSPSFIAAHYASAAASGNTHLFVQSSNSHPPPHRSRAFGRKHQPLVSDKHLLIDLKPLESGLRFLQPSQSSIPSSVEILGNANGVLLGIVQSGNEVRHVLCNPTIHRYVDLPEPAFPFCWVQLALGFVPSKNDIGVVKIIYEPAAKNGMPSLFPPITKVCYARERVWKTIAPDVASASLLFQHRNDHCCINGRIHWAVQPLFLRREDWRFRYEYSEDLLSDSEHLLVFDFEGERFERMDFPGELLKDLKSPLSLITMLLLKQNLSVLIHDIDPNRFILWSMTAYPDVSSWARLWSFNAVREMLYTVFVGWRADYILIVSRGREGTTRVYDPSVGSSGESYVFPFNGKSAECVWGFDESLFLSDEEMQALPLTQIQPGLPN